MQKANVMSFLVTTDNSKCIL